MNGTVNTRHRFEYDVDLPNYSSMQPSFQHAISCIVVFPSYLKNIEKHFLPTVHQQERVDDSSRPCFPLVRIVSATQKITGLGFHHIEPTSLQRLTSHDRSLFETGERTVETVFKRSPSCVHCNTAAAAASAPALFPPLLLICEPVPIIGCSFTKCTVI